VNSGSTMRALTKSAPGAGLELVRLPVPEVGYDDVLIRVAAASICGTDVHIYDWDDWSARRIVPPLVLGHEFAGEVTATGDGVADLPVGTPVSAEGHVIDTSARHVRSGEEHLARDMQVIGIDRPGAFAEYVVVPRRNVWINAPDLSPEICSLQDPFGNAVHTVDAQDVAGKVVLITGAGLIGLMAIPVAKAAGAERVLVTDVNPRRLEMATKMGADRTLDARSDVGAAVADETDGAGVDVLLEMSGHEAAIVQGLAALRPGGEAALLGLPSSNVRLDWGELVVLKGVTLRGIYGRRIWQTWHRMRELLESGKVDLAPLITHRLDLADYERGFELMRSGESGKVILYPGGNGAE
jgi:threonine 3-dehydrogenase